MFLERRIQASFVMPQSPLSFSGELGPIALQKFSRPASRFLQHRFRLSSPLEAGLRRRCIRIAGLLLPRSVPWTDSTNWFLGLHACDWSVQKPSEAASLAAAPVSGRVTDADGFCQASFELPEAWFQVGTSAVSVLLNASSPTTEALSADFVPVTAVLVARQTVASFTNRVVFDLPARTLFPGETFAVPVTAACHVSFGDFFHEALAGSGCLY
jgi:hypothetical protein